MTSGLQTELFDAGADVLDVADVLMWMQEMTGTENHEGSQAGRLDKGICGLQG
jgi:hypothetical protein